MSFRDPEDRDTYTEKSLFTQRFSHGRITLEGYDKVINVSGGIIELEKNTVSKYDSQERLSIIIRGGTWEIDHKKRKPKNAATFRFNDTEKHRAMMEEIAGFISAKTQKLFFCQGRKEEPKKEKPVKEKRKRVKKQ